MADIVTYCRITNDRCFVDGKPIIEIEGPSNVEVASQLYKQLSLSYPKFHKMDLLAMCAFLGVEILKEQVPSLAKMGEDEIALLFANSESSEYSDILFEKSYVEAGNPSPSQFVYTLPNIMMGEIAIRNKWYGENMFLLMPEFNAEELVLESKILLAKSHKACIIGWVNVTGNKLDVFFTLLEDNKGGNEDLTPSTLTQLYNK